MSAHIISSQPLTLQHLQTILQEAAQLALGDDARQKIKRCREFVDQKIARGAGPVYGINTGFGSLYNKHISDADLDRLQENLVKSHACGLGPVVPDEIVRLMLFLKVQSLSYGYSGVQVETVQRLIDFYNHRVYPKVF